MITMAAIEVAVALSVLLATGPTLTLSTNYFEYRLPVRVRLTVHAPTSGADIAFARVQTLHPLFNPGIVPRSYLFVDNLFPVSHHDYGVAVYSRNDVVNNPEADGVNIGSESNIGGFS